MRTVRTTNDITNAGTNADEPLSNADSSSSNSLAVENKAGAAATVINHTFIEASKASLRLASGTTAATFTTAHGKAVGDAVLAARARLGLDRVIGCVPTVRASFSMRACVHVCVCARVCESALSERLL
jgi:hypothetical protein